MDARPGRSAPDVVPAASAPPSPDPAPPLSPDPAVPLIPDLEARLAEIAGWPVDEQVTVFAELHGQLTAALSAAGGAGAGASGDGWLDEARSR